MSNIKKTNVKKLINQLKKELTEKAQHQEKIKDQLKLSSDELMNFHPDAEYMLHEDLAEITKDIQGLTRQLTKANKTLGKPKTPKSKAKPMIKKQAGGRLDQSFVWDLYN
jgi:uncharacterized membrane protein YkoI